MPEDLPVNDGGDQGHDDERRSAGPTLTHSQAVNRLHEIRAEMQRLNELDRLTPEDEAYFIELRDEFDEVDEHRKRLERKHELARINRAAENVDKSIRGLRLIPGSTTGSRSDEYDRDPILHPDSVEDCRFRDPWDLSEVRTFGRDPSDVSQELRSRALSAIEKMQGASDRIRSAATDMLEKFDTRDAKIAQFILHTSKPAYMRAWAKMACNRANTLTVEEQRALAEVDRFRSITLTDAKGGYLVPFQLDPTLIILSGGVRNDIRQVARQVVATGDVWHGVASSHVQWRWAAEESEATDGAPTFSQPTIPNYKADGFVPISIEALADEANVAQEVGRLLAGGKTDLEADALINGTGSGQPTGLITKLKSAGATVVLPSDTTDTFDLADVYKIQGALPARHRANAAWLANNLIYNLIRQFNEDYGGSLWTDLSADRPAMLLGRSALEAEAMDGVINTSQDNYVLVFGDFENYVITDRLGMAVEFIPHLFGTTNGFPTGQRGWYAYYRVGADVVNTNAFRLLNVT